MNKKEIIEMLNILLDNAYGGSDIAGHGCTLIEDVKLDSFIWVINETIGVLETSQGNYTAEETDAIQDDLDGNTDEVLFKRQYRRGMLLDAKITAKNKAKSQGKKSLF